MKIKNFQNLATSKARQKVLEIAEAGLEAIDTKEVIQKNIRLKGQILIIGKRVILLKEVKRFFVIGIGKCALSAAKALEEILGDRISDGIVIDVHEGALKKIKARCGTHPLPSEANVVATKEILNLLYSLNKNDLVLFIISGGGSTLLSQPESFSFDDEAEVVKCLIKSGADIYEMNTVRKHLSLARGGNLAKAAYPAKVISLIFSDVLGDELDIISSGPTVKDSTFIADAQKVLKKYEVEHRCGSAIFDKLIETPKDDKYFQNVENILFLTNETALKAMSQKAKDLNLEVKIVTKILSGEASDVALKIVHNLDEVRSKTLLLYGGETTVTVKKDGKGGRNLELGLSALRFIKKGQIVAAIASDGRDNTDFAGAICDIKSREKALKLDLDLKWYLDENRSYDFFEKIGDYILTGDTGSNVSDLIISYKDQ